MEEGFFLFRVEFRNLSVGREQVSGLGCRV